MISNGCICTNMLLPKCSQVPVLTSRDMTGLYHHRSLRLHVEHDRPVQRVYARQACSCGRAAAGVQLRTAGTPARAAAPATSADAAGSAVAPFCWWICIGESARGSAR